MSDKTEIGSSIFIGMLSSLLVGLLLLFIYQDRNLISPENFNILKSPFSGEIYTNENYMYWDIPLVFLLQTEEWSGDIVYGDSLLSNSDLIEQMSDFDSSYSGYGVWDFYNPFSSDSFNEEIFTALYTSNQGFAMAMDNYANYIIASIGNHSESDYLYCLVLPDFIDAYNDLSSSITIIDVAINPTEDHALLANEVNVIKLGGSTIEDLSIIPVNPEIGGIDFWEWLKMGTSESTSNRLSKIWIIIVLITGIVISTLTLEEAPHNGFSVTNTILIPLISIYALIWTSNYVDESGFTNQITTNGEFIEFYPNLEVLNWVIGAILVIWKWIFAALAVASFITVLLGTIEDY